MRDAALDRADIAEALVGDLDLVGEPHDLPLELIDAGVVVGRTLLVELSGEGLDERFEILRQLHPLGAARVERAGKVVDPVRQRFQVPGAGRDRDPLDAVGERVHIRTQRRDRFGRRDMLGKTAHLADDSLQGMYGFDIDAAGDSIDLGRERMHLLLERTEAFRRGHRVDRLHDFAERALDVRERGRVGAAIVALVDAVGERADLGLQRIERAARHRLVDGGGDLAEIAAQSGDRVLDTGRLAQCLDLLGHVAQLRLQVRKVGARGGARSTLRGFVERALARADLGDRAVDVGSRRDRRGLIAAQRLEFAAHRPEALVDLAMRRAPGGQLIEALVEPRDRVGEPCGCLIGAACRPEGAGVAARPAARCESWSRRPAIEP